MKTYIKSPPIHRDEESKVTQLIPLLKSAFEQKEMDKRYKEIYETLKNYLPFDYIILRNPNSDKSETLDVYPPLDGKIKIPYFSTSEQAMAVLQSKPTRRVGIGTDTDDTVLIHSLNYTFPIKKFSIIFWRDVNNQNALCQIAFISKYTDIFTEQHVATLFALSSVFTSYWKDYNSEELDISDPQASFASSLLSIEDLPGMQSIKKMIIKIARENIPILLLGETGTGKEVVANTIHRFSTRAHNPFIKLNCGSIPDSLIDSELFGHEKGSFTGAFEQVKGKFERANRGMLMLDELGELPMTAQVRLLRVLQESVISRVGGHVEFPVDVRIVAATHRNLPFLIKEGKFRQDLYYRLNIFPIVIPPLRERKEDIPILVQHFIKRRCEQKGILNIPTLTKSETEKICTYHWPGNIRELQNAIERSLILWDEESPLNIKFADEVIEVPTIQTNNPISSTRIMHKAKSSFALDDVIKEHIVEVLEETKWRINGKNGAAELLNINASTLRAKMKKLGLV